MVFSVSALVLFAIILVILIRNKTMKLAHAILGALFGFFLAQSSAASPIQNFLSQIAKTLNDLTS
ncbi:hypothetical protein C7M71_009055 [Peterkaempfera bronchialis]|uniref:Uncharacterized protein n=1 Tax=Peterkaempfera bronchialis TaxID=2126346 RepID=A0A345SV12_9ACTN|nr:hypothetical protein C7M71_009055 [Peterkaempfera bronchialis]